MDNCSLETGAEAGGEGGGAGIEGEEGGSRSKRGRREQKHEQEKEGPEAGALTTCSIIASLDIRRAVSSLSDSSSVILSTTSMKSSKLIRRRTVWLLRRIHRLIKIKIPKLTL